MNIEEKGRILVTGGAGFIGSHVAERLRNNGYDVYILDDLSGGFEENVPSGTTFIRGSILDRALLRDLFTNYRFSYVFHLAAYAAEVLSPFIRHFNYQNNLVGTVNLINLSVEFEVQRFVFTSSIAVYGTAHLPLKEESPLLPADPYGISKYAIELDLKAAFELFGLNYTIFRPHNVYGEKQNLGDRYRNVIGIFMNQVLNDSPLTIFGTGEQTRCFTYIRDVAIPIADCIEHPETTTQIFNVGADQPYSVLDLAHHVIKAMKKTMPIHHLPARHEVVHAIANNQKYKEFFKNLPNPTSLDEGLARMARWAHQQGPRETFSFANLELTKNLPTVWQLERNKRL